MSQLKSLRDRFASGGYRAASTSDIVLLIDALRLDLGDTDPVAPTQTAGDADEQTSGEVPPSSPEVDPAPAPETAPVDEPPASDGEDPWNAKD